MLNSTFLDKLRHIPITLALPGKVGLQMSGDYSVQRIFFGIARTVDALELQEDVAECKLRRIRPLNPDNNLRLATREKIRWNGDN